jgi:hypothetical protein
MTHLRYCAAMAALFLSAWGNAAQAGGAAITTAPPAEPRTAQVGLAIPVKLVI